MSDERDPQAHRIMELSRELDALRATVERVSALAEELDREAPDAEVWDGDEERVLLEVSARIRAALSGDR